MRTAALVQTVMNSPVIRIAPPRKSPLAGKDQMQYCNLFKPYFFKSVCYMVVALTNHISEIKKTQKYSLFHSFFSVAHMLTLMLRARTFFLSITWIRRNMQQNMYVSHFPACTLIFLTLCRIKCFACGLLKLTLTSPSNRTLARPPSGCLSSTWATPLWGVASWVCPMPWPTQALHFLCKFHDCHLSSKYQWYCESGCLICLEGSLTASETLNQFGSSVL